MCCQSALPIEEFSFRKSGKRYKTCNECRARAAQLTTNAAEHDSEPVSGWLLIAMHGGNIKTNSVLQMEVQRQPRQRRRVGTLQGVVADDQPRFEDRNVNDATD
jgi:hypothetical protein